MSDFRSPYQRLGQAREIVRLRTHSHHPLTFTVDLRIDQSDTRTTPLRCSLRYRRATICSDSSTTSAIRRKDTRGDSWSA